MGNRVKCGILTLLPTTGRSSIPTVVFLVLFPHVFASRVDRVSAFRIQQDASISGSSTLRPVLVERLGLLHHAALDELELLAPYATAP